MYAYIGELCLYVGVLYLVKNQNVVGDISEEFDRRFIESQNPSSRRHFFPSGWCEGIILFDAKQQQSIDNLPNSIVYDQLIYICIPQKRGKT